MAAEVATTTIGAGAAPDVEGRDKRPLASRGSLRTRITAVAVGIVVAVLLVTAVALIGAQHELLQSALDEALTERADELAAEIAGSATWPPVLEVPTDEDVAWQVIDDGGGVVAASTSLSGAPSLAIESDAATDRTIVTRSEPALDDEAFAYRLLIRHLSSVPGSVIVAGDLEDVLASTRTLTVLLAIAIPVVAVVLAVLVWVVVGRTLRPVEDIRTTVASIGARSLGRRVPRPPADDEIGRLADTMNDMLDRLDDASRRQQLFVADASHELRTPLTRLRARLELELERAGPAGSDAGSALPDRSDASAPSAEDREAALRDALGDTIALQRLADDLLALARGDPDVAPEPRTPIDLDDIVLREARRLRENGHVDVDTSAVSAAHVMGEPAGLTRVVRNLLDNAERHARSRVTVSLIESGAVAVLAVEDDGPGIPPAERELIFERFARIDDARTRDSGGTGLGLAIVRDIVARHDGSVSVDPDHSPGARFVVNLPTEAADRAR